MKAKVRSPHPARNARAIHRQHDTGREGASWGKHLLLGFVLLFVTFLILGTPLSVGGSDANSASSTGENADLRSAAPELIASLPSKDELRPESERLAGVALQDNRLIRVMRAERVRLSSPEILKHFTTRLDVRQLGRAIMLAGFSDTKKLLATTGLKEEQYERLCMGPEHDYALYFSQTLLDWSAQEGPLPAGILVLQELHGDHPRELREELVRSSLRALAAGCLTRHLEEQSRKYSGSRLASR